MALTPVTLPGLLDRETAYTLDTGETIVITTTQHIPPNDPSWVVLQIDVDIVDPHTMATLHSLVSHPWSVPLKALQGSTTIEAETKQAHVEAERWAMEFLGARKALDALAATPAPGVPVTRDRTQGRKKVGRVR